MRRVGVAGVAEVAFPATGLQPCHGGGERQLCDAGGVGVTCSGEKKIVAGTQCPWEGNPDAINALMVGELEYVMNGIQHAY